MTKIVAFGFGFIFLVIAVALLCAVAKMSHLELIALLALPVLKAFRQRLQDAGKPPKLAIIAAARKLATILNAMLKTQTPYTP